MPKPPHDPGREVPGRPSRAAPPLAAPLAPLAAALLGAVLAGGCAGQAPGRAAGKGGYHTVAVDPQRDADAARRLNGEALRAMSGAEADGADRGGPPDRAADRLARADAGWAEAERLLKAALDADVTFGPAHNNLGTIYYRSGRLYLAAWEFQYAGKLMPDRPEPRNNLGLVLEDAGKLDEAVKAYDDAVNLAPNGAEFLGNAARARVRRGDGGAEVEGLLDRLVLHDSRPEWVGWARERLAVMGAAR